MIERRKFKYKERKRKTQTKVGTETLKEVAIGGGIWIQTDRDIIMHRCADERELET